jgi:hypothetical protein
MLEWLKRRRQQIGTLVSSRTTTASRVAVSFDDHSIRVTLPSGTDIGAVNIVTTADGPFEADLFWLLQSLDRKTNITIPMGAEGEHDLLLRMQARLLGFDNMAVVEAMSSTGPAGFVVWDPDHAAAEEV